MISQNALVLYKTRPAVVTGTEGEKILISFKGEKSGIKVREKDVELLHAGPFNPGDWEEQAAGDVRSAWELLAESGETVILQELAGLVFNEFTPQSALASWKLVEENLFFTGDIKHIKARSKTELETEEKRRADKQTEINERSDFLQRMRTIISANNSSKSTVTLTEQDRRYLQDTEALARGQSDKSRTLKEMGISETPVDAHRFLLAAGAWTVWDNPYPARFGLTLSPVKTIAEPPPEENRVDTDRIDLTHLPAFAIDNAYSDDPDDAISLEGPDSQGRLTLWVHTADPAACVIAGSPADTEAQNRGSTLYLPEQICRMLAPQITEKFILKPGPHYNGVTPDNGITPDNGVTPALSFKLLLNPDSSIAETQIFLSRIKVTCLNYEEADKLADSTGADNSGAGDIDSGAGNTGGHGIIIKKLFELAEKNLERRLETGAVNIELPEVHIRVIKGTDNGNNSIEIDKNMRRRSADMVRECMILAGEGAALWAVKNRVPFPFICQEAGELPDNPLPGPAGAYQIRRSMRPRSLSSKPGVHWGLGLDAYTQVTSPLRRYTDLLAHQQIRAFLKGGPLLSEDEILLRAARAEAGAAAAAKAERASNTHWKMVYLSDKTGSSWEGIILENRGNRSVVLIPDLGLETPASLRNGEPNEKITLTCAGVKIPEAQALFTV
ncbi:MAG: RNB domain-containing ribonuclease [Treponema sp.]|nr:RNB domain-containing ribonuclease [Treponema sp.]